MEQKNGLPVVNHRLCRGLGKYMALSLPCLQEWWRSFSYTLHHDAHIRGYTFVLFGALLRTICEERPYNCVEQDLSINEGSRLLQYPHIMVRILLLQCPYSLECLFHLQKSAVVRG